MTYDFFCNQNQSDFVFLYHQEVFTPQDIVKTKYSRKKCPPLRAKYEVCFTKRCLLTVSIDPVLN